MTFTFANLIDSIAGQLADNFKGVPIYDSPSYNTEYPCFYVFLVNPKIDDGIDGTYIRNTMLDIVYIQQRDSSAQNVELINVLEKLDECMDMITYVDGDESALLHTYERNGNIEDQELHYKLRIKQRMSVDKEHIYMNEMEEENAEIKGNE